MKLGSLFTGYGGLDQAVGTVLNTRTVWHSEINPGANKILAHNYPNIPNLGDITNINWGDVEHVDVLTGGFPCQDLSSAGLRKGIKEGTRSGLWAVMAEAVNALKPRLVVIENVRGILSAPAHSNVESCAWCLGDNPSEHVRALGAVLSDLAGIGYNARWCGVRAADVGAPHSRYRVFIIAHPNRTGWEGLPHPQGTTPARRSGHAKQSIDAVTWGGFAPAIRKWAGVIGRPPPPPAERGPSGHPRLNPVFVEWMMGLDEGHVTSVPGLGRGAQLQALGNGVVPQQAAAALRYLLGCEVQ